MTNLLTITLTPDMVLKVFKHQLEQAIDAARNELSYINCLPGDARECSNIIDAATYLLGVYFGSAE